MEENGKLGRTVFSYVGHVAPGMAMMIFPKLWFFSDTKTSTRKQEMYMYICDMCNYKSIVQNHAIDTAFDKKYLPCNQVPLD